MNSKFDFICPADKSIGMTISTDIDNESICDIKLSYEGRDYVGIEYGVYDMEELEKIISALIFIREEAMKDIERETPRER